MHPVYLFIPLLCCTPLQAERKSPMPDMDDGRVSFYLDNDLFAGTDRDYTNGARLSWISGRRETLGEVAPIQRFLSNFNGSPDSLDPFQRLWGFKNSDDINYQYGMALTQLMYTPDTTDAIPPPNQRPYAGWLGLGFSLHASDDSAINSIEFSVGIVGPHAYAEATQDFVHSIKQVEKFHGWDTQIPDEFTLDITFAQKRRHHYLDPEDIAFLPFSFNGFTDLGFSLGSFRTSIDAGWHLQFGYNVPVDYSEPRLTPTANSISWDPGASHPKFSAYMLAGFRGSFIIHDITIDGPLFRDYDTGIDREPLVGEVYAGLAIRYKDIEFSYIQNVRTREYKQQENHQDFGSLAVRIRY